MQDKNLRRVVAIAFVLLVGSALHADTLGFTNYSQWAAVTTGATTITFNGLAGSSYTDYSTAAGLTVGGVTFTGPAAGGGYGLWVMNPNLYPAGLDWGTGDVLHGLGGPDAASAGSQTGAITATLNGGYTSISFNLMTFQPYAQPVLVTLSNGAQFLVQTGNYPTPTFFGITSTDGITSVTFQSMGQSGFAGLNIDNFVYGTDPPCYTNCGDNPLAPTVPEPAMLSMMGIGLAALVTRLRKR